MCMLDSVGSMSHLDDLFSAYPEHLSVPQVSEILGVQRSTVYKWLKEGTIPAYQVGTTWVILRDEVKEIVASGRNLREGMDESTGDPPEGKR